MWILEKITSLISEEHDPIGLYILTDIIIDHDLTNQCHPKATIKLRTTSEEILLVKEVGLDNSRIFSSQYVH